MIQICQKDKEKVYDAIRTGKINDMGFLSREMTNYLKTARKVDTYIPARENMAIHQDAVTLAATSGK